MDNSKSIKFNFNKVLLKATALVVTGAFLISIIFVDLAWAEPNSFLRQSAVRANDRLQREIVGAIINGLTKEELKEWVEKHGSVIEEETAKKEFDKEFDIINSVLTEERKSELFKLAEKLGIEKEEMLHRIIQARDDLLLKNGKILKQFPDLVQSSNKYGLGLGIKEYLSYVQGMLEKLKDKPDLRAEYLLHEALCYHFQELKGKEGHQIALQTQKILFPQNYENVVPLESDSHPELTGKLTLELREFIEDKVQPITPEENKPIVKQVTSLKEKNKEIRFYSGASSLGKVREWIKKKTGEIDDLEIKGDKRKFRTEETESELKQKELEAFVGRRKKQLGIEQVDIKTELIKLPPTRRGQVFGDIKINKMRIQINRRLSMVESKRTISHELGHIKFKIEYPFVDTLLQILMLPLRIVWFLPFPFSYLVFGCLSLGIPLALNLGFTYTCLIIWPPVFTYMIEELLVNRLVIQLLKNDIILEENTGYKAFKDSMDALKGKAKKKYKKRAKMLGKALIKHKFPAPQSLILYAKPLLENFGIGDLEEALGILLKNNALYKVIIYSEEPENGEILEMLIKDVKEDLETVKITKKELRPNINEVEEVDELINFAEKNKKVKKEKILGIIKGMTKDREALEELSEKRGIRIVVVKKVKGKTLYSMAGAFQFLISADSGLFEFPPLVKIKDIQKEYKEYKESLRELSGA